MTQTFQLSIPIRKTRLFLGGLAFLLCLCWSGQAFGQSVVRGPYLQTGTQTSITVKWRTSSSTSSKVFYGTSPAALTLSVVSGSSKTNHELTISGLSPNTQYYYAIGNQAGILEGGTAGYHFITTPPDNTRQKVRAWILGDSGTADGNAAAVRDGFTNYNNLEHNGEHVDIMMMLGDNAYNSGTDSEYQDAVFDMYPEWLRKVALWPTPGNHDYYSTVNNYLSIFTLPIAGEAGGNASGTELYYSFNYDNIHFISLDSHGTSRSTSGAMHYWLENDLMNVTQDWIVAFWHHPPYTKGSHDSDSESRLIEMRENFLPLLESYGVDLVLGGHSHSYERSMLLNGHYGNSGSLNPSTMILDNGDGDLTGDGAYQKTVTGSTAGDGAVYIVAGSSGKISGVSQHPAMYTWQNQLGSVLLEVEGSDMTVRFINKDGENKDEFTIQKDIDNQAPIAVDDNDVTFQTIPVTVDVLANDSDPNGSLDLASLKVTSGPSNGMISVNTTTGEITYTPNPGFDGIDSFDYEICDDGVPPPVECSTATVTIDVQINYAPVAVDDSKNTNESTFVVIDVLDNDSDANGNMDPATVQVVTPPASGGFMVNSSTGEITYSPGLAFIGTDMFTYTVLDDLMAVSNIATVTVNVLANVPPLADDDDDTTTEGTAVVVAVLTNDSDLNGDLDPNSISTAGVLQPSYGSVLAIPGVGVQYTPDPGYTGYDQFEYQVCDLSNPAPLCDVATVTVLVDCDDVVGYNLIKGTVFEDANLDGINLVENGQGSVSVTLYNDNNQNGIKDGGDTQEAVTTTASDGTYSFSVSPVYFTPGSTSVAISQDTDDAWEKDNGDVENDKDDHEMGEIDSHVGLRFQNVNIPAGAVITNAYVEFTSSKNEDNTPSAVNFYTELSSSPATFVEQDYGITSRGFSSGNVHWNHGEWFQNQLYQSPDLSSIIQEVVDLGSWNAGDDLVIIGESLGSEKRKYRTHDKKPNLAPRLFVDYEVPGQDDYYYVVEIDPGTLPSGALLTTDNVETTHFTAPGQTDCLNYFGFSLGDPPVVSVTNPADEAVLTNLNVNLQANASDPDGTIAQVEFFVDGASVGFGVYNSPSYEISYSFSLNGTYDITAIATDDDGLSTLSATNTITIAVLNTAPLVTITAPANGAPYTSAQSIYIDATATDPDGTVTQVEFFVDGVSIEVDLVAPYSANYFLDIEGPYTIEAVATDNLGGTNDDQISVTLDIPNDSPAVSITDPADGEEILGPQQITITAAANDPDGTIAGVEFFVEGVSIGTDNTVPYTMDYDVLTVGFYDLEAEATDDMGASTLSTLVTIEMQAVPTPVSFSVQSASDDAREKNDGKVEDDKDAHELGKEGFIGVRFQGVTIPPGAMILAAHVVFKSEGDEDNTPARTRIFGEADPNPQTFVENKWNISTRPQTSNFVNWTFGEWFKNQSYPSPDLTSIVQELVNQPGWQSGNAMAFLFDATGSQRRKAYAFEESAAEGPQLEITYMGGGQAAVQQVTQPLSTPFDIQPEAEFPVVGDLLIYPNPTQYELYLEFESLEEMPVTINLYDVSGRLIRSNQFNIQKGFNRIDYSTENASEGTHFIHLKNDKISKLEKVIFIKR